MARRRATATAEARAVPKPAAPKPAIAKKAAAPKRVRTKAPGSAKTIGSAPPVAPVDAGEEATAVATLEANQQCADEGVPLAPGQTHQMVRQPDGELKPVRRRFSSI